MITNRGKSRSVRGHRPQRAYSDHMKRRRSWPKSGRQSQLLQTLRRLYSCPSHSESYRSRVQATASCSAWLSPSTCCHRAWRHCHCHRISRRASPVERAVSWATSGSSSGPISWVSGWGASRRAWEECTRRSQARGCHRISVGMRWAWTACCCSSSSLRASATQQCRPFCCRVWSTSRRGVSGGWHSRFSAPLLSCSTLAICVGSSQAARRGPRIHQDGEYGLSLGGRFLLRERHTKQFVNQRWQK